MRDPNRIPEVMNAIGVAWMANPDMRLGQLIINAGQLGGVGVTHLWNAEEDVFLKGLQQLAQGDVG